MQRLRNFAKKVLPNRFVNWYRRRRQVRAYLNALGHELHERQTRLDDEGVDVEDQIAARHDGFYQRAVKEILDRTDLVLQELDRRIEGISVRYGNDIRELKAQVASLRNSVTALRAEVAEGRSAAVPVTASAAPVTVPVATPEPAPAGD
jgi:hypothetical protein